MITERNYSPRGDVLHSVSYAQKPDAAVEVRLPHIPARVYLLDPKYKLEGEFLEGESSDGKFRKVDIDRMHAYRDVIRDEKGRRIVRYAAILYPGPGIAYAGGLEGLTAYPGLDQALERRIRELLGEALDSTEVPHK